MALFQEWKAAVTRDPALLAGAIEEGIRALGIRSIKPDQLTAVKSLLYGEDVFVSAPTGFGKSLVYQLLPFCSASLLRSCLCTNKSPVVVVVSPLVSLMYDQVTKLVKKGVKAACVSGDSQLVWLDAPNLQPTYSFFYGHRQGVKRWPLLLDVHAQPSYEFY